MLLSLLCIQTLELLAKVVMLKEEDVRLEEQIGHLGKCLFYEAIYISLSNKHIKHVENDEQSIAKRLDSPYVSFTESPFFPRNSRKKRVF